MHEADPHLGGSRLGKLHPICGILGPLAKPERFLRDSCTASRLHEELTRNQIGFDERGIPARRSNSLLFLGGLATDHIDLQLVFQVVFSLSYFY